MLKRIWAGESLERPGRTVIRMYTTRTPAAWAPSTKRTSRGTIGGYIEMSIPSWANAPPGVQKSRCMSTTTSAVWAGSTSSESSVNTCFPSISIMLRAALCRHVRDRTGGELSLGQVFLVFGQDAPNRRQLLRRAGAEIVVGEQPGDDPGEHDPEHQVVWIRLPRLRRRPQRVR